MTAPPSLVPKEISHEIDLSVLTPDQRQAHHIRALRQAGFLHGATGQAEYRRQHPEAAHLRGNVNALAYAPKPQGYDAAIIDTVQRWLDGGSAVAETNRADVERLNVRLETTRFDPRNHFSKPLSPALRAKVQELFAQRGAPIDATGLTMAKAKQAARAFTATGQPDAQPFGTVGTRIGDTLTIGGRSFTVGRHGNRECISVTADGGTQRVFLSTVAAICAGLQGGAVAGETSDYLLRSRTGELCRDAKSGDRDRAAPTRRILPTDTPPVAAPLNGRTLPDAAPIDPEPLTLSEKIRRLSAILPGNAPAGDVPALPDGVDPLEL